MKNNGKWFLSGSHWLLNLMKVLLDIALAINIGFIFVILFVMSMNFFSQDYSDFDAKVKYPLSPVAKIFQSKSDNTKDITITASEAVLKMKMKNTALYIIPAYLLFVFFELLVMVIIFNLRKLFKSLKHNVPFQNENVKRLKITALCFVLFLPLNMLKGLLTHIILSNNVVGYKDSFWMVWSESFIFLAIGVVIYIMADIFKYGLELQKENEEFV